MNRSKPLFLILLMLLAAGTPAFAPATASGPKALVDFTIQDITFGNASQTTQQWTQPDTSMKEYSMRAVPIEIMVTFKQAGSSISSANAVGFIQIWHPVGTLTDQWSVNLSLTGGQSHEFRVVWTPSASHSVLDESGNLSGGYLIRGVVDGGLSEGNPANDIVDRNLPIAVAYDPMERGACPSCGAGVTYYSPTFASVGYESGTDNADGYGPWRLDNSTGADGTSHWRHSVPGQQYESLANDWLYWGWFIPQGEPCDDPGHGLGYGTLDSDITYLYGIPFCRVSVQGFDYISMQLATLAFGGLGMNDEVVLGANTVGTSTIAGVNLSESGISGTTDDWTRVIWNMSGGQLETNQFNIGFHFTSDNSGATAGLHIDQWLIFGIEKVDDYTITLNCDNPETGYIVIPADPLPPSLHCYLTNNGYKTKTIRIDANVDNDTWMNFHSPIRIDSNNINDHDYSVPLNPLAAGDTTEFWVNLTVPPGANVEELNWTVNFSDYYIGSPKANMLIPLSVAASYSVDIRYVGSTIALELPPGGSGQVMLTLTNTGNQMAYWNLNAYFNRSDWSTQNIRFLSNGSDPSSQITYIQLQKAEAADFWANFTAPAEIGEGLTEVTLVAQGQSPANAQTSRKLTLNIPQTHDLVMTPSQSIITAEADGHTRTVEVDLRNNGNDAERFDLELSGDWRLGASLNQPVTEEIGAFGDTSTILLILPMPYGVRADTYFLLLKATSQSNPDYFRTLELELNVETTHLISVADVDMTGQTFVGGADSKTIAFEVTNNGNGFDEFTVELDIPLGMNAVIVPNEQYNPDSPPSVDEGASVNVTIEYSFDSGTSGLLKLVVTAQSAQSGGAVGDSGEASFQVGSQGWLELTAGEVVVIDSEGWIYANVTVHNRHPTNTQMIRLDVDAGDARQYASVRIKTSDASFVLDPDLKRTASVKFSLTETQYMNLPESEMLFNVTVMATGDDDVAETVVQIRVTKDPSSFGSDSDADSGGLTVMTVFGWIFGLAVVVLLLAVLVYVVRSTNLEEEEISSLSGYQSQLEAAYGTMPAAPIVPESGPTVPDSEPPPLPSTDTVANSPYGGAAQIFEQQVTPAPSEPAVELPPGAAELPPGGLPNGWTLEQWTHYGHQYRQQKGLD